MLLADVYWLYVATQAFTAITAISYVSAASVNNGVTQGAFFMLIGQASAFGRRILTEVRASQLAQASERAGSPIPASQQG